MVVLAGNPGTGKTVFPSELLHRGVTDFRENGMYVSFAESRESFLENMLGFGFENLGKAGKFTFLEM